MHSLMGLRNGDLTQFVVQLSWSSHDTETRDGKEELRAGDGWLDMALFSGKSVCEGERDKEHRGLKARRLPNPPPMACAEDSLAMKSAPTFCEAPACSIV